MDPRRVATFWTPERIALLATLWADPDLIVADIGCRLGATRAAVAAKAWALKLPLRRPSYTPARLAVASERPAPIPVATTRRREVRWTPSVKLVERIFGAYEKFAEYGQELPTSIDLVALLGTSTNTLTKCSNQLIRDGRISVEWNQGTHHRKITILTGPQAGKVIETVRRVPRPPVAPKIEAPVVKAVATLQPKRCCQWCEGPFTRARDCSSYCSRSCADAARSYGPLVTRRQVEARRAHIAEQPRGCKTVDEWLAAGGVPYREPPTAFASAGA